MPVCPARPPAPGPQSLSSCLCASRTMPGAALCGGPWQLKGGLRQLPEHRARPRSACRRDSQGDGAHTAIPSKSALPPQGKADPSSPPDTQVHQPPPKNCPPCTDGHLVHGRHFGSFIQQQLHHFDVSHLGGLDQRRFTILWAQIRTCVTCVTLIARLLNV